MLFKKGILNNIPDKYRQFIVPEDEKDLKKLEKIQRVIEKLDRDFDMKAVNGRRSRDSLEDDSSSRLSGIARPAAVIASTERPSRHKKLTSSMSMGPIRDRVVDDVRIENVKKRMTLERLNKPIESDSENGENTNALQMEIERNFKSAKKVGFSKQVRDPSNSSLASSVDGGERIIP